MNCVLHWEELVRILISDMVRIRTIGRELEIFRIIDGDIMLSRMPKKIVLELEDRYKSIDKLE
jgi:hypothetical protein